MAFLENVLLWSKNREPEFTFYAAVLPCFFAGIFKEMTSYVYFSSLFGDNRLLIMLIRKNTTGPIEPTITSHGVGQRTYAAK
ncbi:hypothetical protein G4B88_010547 [Cannabis sativa]|uniref:Uncharacterized protein n=1 Tax=Cannabis sativa TaxID=3483 RepID=A0A7J6G856_CANSA|nr:hypothetical protein G4B88_010547 [Cannabis sativa]